MHILTLPWKFSLYSTNDPLKWCVVLCAVYYYQLSFSFLFSEQGCEGKSGFFMYCNADH
jgi:uncharacterized membrane protein YeiB